MTPYILDIIIGVLAVLVSFVGYYFYIRAKINKAATYAINNAEASDVVGAKKLAAATDQVYALVPTIMRPIISRALIEQLIQEAFDGIEAYARKQLAKKGNQEEGK